MNPNTGNIYYLPLPIKAELTLPPNTHTLSKNNWQPGLKAPNPRMKRITKSNALNLPPFSPSWFLPVYQGRTRKPNRK
jgi:hypothetical protein